MTKAILDKYHPTIGIECHVQLRTVTKLFSGADNDALGKAPNTVVSPICFGLPGTLPVLNREAVNLTIRAGLALHAEIATVSSFDRKHYFYPDLPKGYQITQLERPTVGRGKIDVPLPDGTSFPVRITRAHIEEDAGKLTHPDGADYSLVDLNRAGTPLIEIVSEADMHSPEQAKAYVQELYLLMKYAEVTNGDLSQGNMRFDINISVAPAGSDKLGKRAEIKNLNSFRSVERAAAYEWQRQAELLERGEKIAQETRGWNDAKQKTFSQRSKEDAMDYRYFPDADLPPIKLDEQAIADIRGDMPPLPPELRQEFAKYGVDKATAEMLIQQYALTKPHGDVGIVLAIGDIKGSAAARFAANFLANRFAPRLAEDAQAAMPEAHHFMKTFDLFEAKELSSNAADELLFKLAGKDTGIDVRAFAKEQGLLQENDTAALQAFVDDVLADPSSASAIKQIKAGNDRVVGFLVGQVMKRSGGTANPGAVHQLIKERLERVDK